MTTCLGKVTLVAFSKKLGKSFSNDLGSFYRNQHIRHTFSDTWRVFFFISISKHIRFILQNNADFRMGRKGDVGSLLCRQRHITARAQHTGEDLENSLHDICVAPSGMTKQRTFWASSFVHGPQDEEKSEFWYSWCSRAISSLHGPSTLIWAVLFFFLLVLRNLGVERKAEWQPFHVMSFLIPHLFGNTIYWG